MTAENELPPSAQGDAGLLDEAGVAPTIATPASPRKCTLNQIEHALDLVLDFGRHDPWSVVQEQAEFLEGMVPVIIDAIWAAHHYRTRGHHDVPGEKHWLQITSWVHKDVAAAADNVVRWVDL